MSVKAPRVCEVRREPVRWLWSGRIPLSKLSVLDGDPGLGKSTVALDLAARLSTMSPLPDGARLDFPMSTLVLSSEDAVADTIRPRLEAHGADLKRVTVFEAVEESEGRARPPELPRDLEVIEGLIDEEDARLIIVDPLMAFLSTKVDSHRDQDVRRVLYMLSQMAERKSVAVVAIRHLNKMPGGSALYRGGGSIGIIGAARAGMLIAPDPGDENRRILAMTKSNLAAKPPSLAYRLVPDEEHGCARINWDGESALTADALLNPARESKRDEAAEFLEDLLASGPMPARDVYREAEAEGISEMTLKRAKKTLGVESYRKGEEGEVGGGAWWWLLRQSKGVNDLGDQPLHTHLIPLISAGQSVPGNGQEVKGVNSDDAGNGVPPGSGRCDFCHEMALSLEDLGPPADGRACLDCAPRWRPEVERSAHQNGSLPEGWTYGKTGDCAVPRCNGPCRTYDPDGRCIHVKHVLEAEGASS